MEIEWGEFYFQCEKTVAILLAAGPLVLIMQLPPVIRGISKLINKFKGTKLGEDIARRVRQAEESEAS